jgi:hypothetical protein
MSYYSNNQKSLKMLKKKGFSYHSEDTAECICVVLPKPTNKAKTRLQFCQSVIEGLASRNFQGLPQRHNA